MSEEHVQKALKNIREQKKVTTVTIAHRLTTIIDNDVIAVISDGSIAELGNHETLIRKEKGIYQHLCETQGITPENSGNSNETEHVAATPQAPAEVAKSTSDKTKLNLAGDDAETEDKSADMGEIEEEAIPMALMSKIWGFVGGDIIYAIIGLIGSAGVGELSLYSYLIFVCMC